MHSMGVTDGYDFHGRHFLVSGDVGVRKNSFIQFRESVGISNQVHPYPDNLIFYLAGLNLFLQIPVAHGAELDHQILEGYQVLL